MSNPIVDRLNRLRSPSAAPDPEQGLRDAFALHRLGRAMNQHREERAARGVEDDPLPFAHLGGMRARSEGPWTTRSSMR